MNKFDEYTYKLIGKLTYLFRDADELVKKKTGKGIVTRMTEAREKDEVLREQNPALWAAKKIAVGTLKGIAGSALTHK